MRIPISILALTLAAAPSASLGASSPPAEQHADWLRRPELSDLEQVWPKAALARGHGGRAVMECAVTTQGALEACQVLSEEPAGEGFGGAALLLASGFLMKPAMKDGKPVRSLVRIPIVWAAPIGYGLSASDGQTILQDPIWAQAPSFADMAAAWPKNEKAPFGHVSMRCKITHEGTLRNCDVLTEEPKNGAFGWAARMAIAPKFRLLMSPGAADRLSKVSLQVAVHFINPALNAPHTIVQPRWIVTLDPAKVQAIYPAKAADAGVTSGKGFADCTVATDGRLVDCQPASANPEGLGFAEAAVQVAQAMQMNPWTDGGSPVDGVRLRLPVGFNLAPAAPSAAK